MKSSRSPRHAGLAPWRPVSLLSRVVLVCAVLGTLGSPRSIHAEEPKVPSGKALKPLVNAYMDASFGERETLRRGWDASLPPIAPTTLARLRKDLLKRAAKHGPKLAKSGTNYFYDEKTKRGKYIVRGKPGKTLFIGLHGGGAGSGDAGSASGSMGGAGWWWIFPEVLKKTEHGWTDAGTEAFVMDLIEAAKRTAKVDLDRIYITGHSMGGYGSWTLGAHHADVFAGVAPYAGAPTCIRDRNTRALSMVQPGILPAYFALPIHVFQSGDDRNVPPESNDFAMKAMADLKNQFPDGFSFTYDRVDGRGHAAPAEGYLPTQKTLAARSRDPRPRHFLWQPVLDWKRQMYWVYWPRAEQEALIEFRAPGGNRIEIETHEGSGDVAGMSILLGTPLVDLDREVVVTVNGEERFRGKVERTFSTLMMTLPRNDPHLLFDARIDL